MKFIAVCLKKKTTCTECRKKMYNGQTVLTAVDEKGKTKAYFCSESCENIFKNK